MKICYIADCRSIHARKLADYFVSEGHEVSVISVGGPKIKGAKYYLVRGLFPILRFPYRLLRIRSLVRKIKPEVIHAHPLGLAFYASLSGFRPVIASAWGSDVFVAPKFSLWKKEIQYVLKSVNALTADSHNLKEAMVHLGADIRKIHMINYGLDRNLFKRKVIPQFKSKLGLSNSKVILSMRSFEELYNIETIILAMPTVLKLVPEAKLLLIGSGSLETQLKALAKKLNLDKAVIFIGKVQNSEVPKFMSISDVYVSIPSSDSSSISLLEAMACKIAPVVCDNESYHEWLTDGENCFITSKKDPVDLGNKIALLLKEPRLRRIFGIRNREVTKIADIGKELGHLLNIYKGLALEKRNGNLRF